MTKRLSAWLAPVLLLLLTPAAAEPLLIVRGDGQYPPNEIVEVKPRHNKP